MVKSVRELDVYKRAYALGLEIHKATLAFPQIEQYALASQMRRASKGICANLAEGYAKSHKSQPEFRRFLLMAVGSAEEMQVWIDFAGDLGYVEPQNAATWLEEYIIMCKQINKLISAVENNVR